MGMRNTLGQLANNLFISGMVKYTSGVPALDHSSNLAHAGDVSLTDTGSGDFNLVIANFKGPRGLADPVVSTKTISVFASATAATYSGDTLTVTVKVEADDSTATDADVYFHVHAY